MSPILPLSLTCGCSVSSLGECCFLISASFSLDNWSVFLQDGGVTLFGSDSTDLISIEGITSVWLLDVILSHRPLDVWSSCGRPVGSEVFTHSAVFTSGVDSECLPLANKGVGLGPSSAGPVASRPPLVGVFLCRYSAHGGSLETSGSWTSREGVLACIQGASDSLRHPPSWG